MKRNRFYALLCAAALLSGCTTDGYFGVYEMDSNGLAYKADMGEEENHDQFAEFTDNPFVKASEECTSTFSIDADGASYAIMRRYLERGYKIYPSMVRIEEYLNYFTFDYPSPEGSHTAAINAEMGPCPWEPAHKLLRLGVKGKELAQNEMPKANYVFLIDVSGSMDSSDKLKLLKSGMIELVDNLNTDDRISIVTYSGAVKKLLESTPVKEANKIKKAIKQLSASGSTNGEGAIHMAYAEAMANFIPDGNNRIIMGTDGDFNVGVTSIDSLVSLVEGYASKGIYLTLCGFGSGNLNDNMMEKISNSGNGTYEFIDSEDEMMRVFVKNRSRFVSVASDAKCQVTFDSTLVDSYRLIGYENRVMSNEEFVDDTKDAGEIGAGQTITALYEIIPTAQFAAAEAKEAIATFDFRYKKNLADESIPLQKKVLVGEVENEKTVTENLRFASGVAAYGMLLRRSSYKGESSFEMAEKLVEESLSFDPNNYRAQLLTLIREAKKNQSEE